MIIFICIYECSPGTSIIQIYYEELAHVIYRFNINIYLLCGIGSPDYGDGEVPRSAICKRKTQENQWYDSVQTPRSENPELTP